MYVRLLLTAIVLLTTCSRGFAGISRTDFPDRLLYGFIKGRASVDEYLQNLEDSPFDEETRNEVEAQVVALGFDAGAGTGIHVYMGAVFIRIDQVKENYASWSRGYWEKREVVGYCVFLSDKITEKYEFFLGVLAGEKLLPLQIGISRKMFANRYFELALGANYASELFSNHSFSDKGYLSLQVVLGLPQQVHK